MTLRPSPASAASPAPYPGGKAPTPEEFARMRTGAQMLSTAQNFLHMAANPAPVAAPPLDRLLTGAQTRFATAISTIDDLGRYYPDPPPEWKTWETQARSGYAKLESLVAQHAEGAAVDAAALDMVRAGARAGASLLNSWDG